MIPNSATWDRFVHPIHKQMLDSHKILFSCIACSNLLFIYLFLVRACANLWYKTVSVVTLFDNRILGFQSAAHSVMSSILPMKLSKE